MTLLVGETNRRSSVRTFVHRYELDTSAPTFRSACRDLATRALLPQGWADEVLVRIDADGVISSVQPNLPAPAGAERVGLLLPGVPDVHSHAFQRAMAGLTEVLCYGTAVVVERLDR